MTGTGRLTPVEVERLEALLGEVRRLELRVDVSDRVLARVATLVPGVEAVLTRRQVTWGIVSASAGFLIAASGLAAVLLSPPAGLARAALGILRTAGPAFLALASRWADAMSRVMISLLEIAALPAGDGRMPMLVSTGAASACLLIAFLATTGLLWRDLRRSAPLLRRSPWIR